MARYKETSQNNGEKNLLAMPQMTSERTDERRATTMRVYQTKCGFPSRFFLHEHVTTGSFTIKMLKSGEECREVYGWWVGLLGWIFLYHKKKRKNKKRKKGKAEHITPHNVNEERCWLKLTTHLENSVQFKLWQTTVAVSGCQKLSSTAV